MELINTAERGMKGAAGIGPAWEGKEPTLLQTCTPVRWGGAPVASPPAPLNSRAIAAGQFNVLTRKATDRRGYNARQSRAFARLIC